VSGTIKIGATTVSATLTTAAAGQPAASFQIQWQVGGGSGALAQVTGSANGETIEGTTYAP
jgi:hypothetical protein